jgi:hypothetical protein
MMKSKFLTITVKDITRGILIAFITAILTGIIDMLDTGAVFNWLTLKPVIIAGVSAALSYLLKCLFSNSRDQLFTREPD